MSHSQVCTLPLSSTNSNRGSSEHAPRELGLALGLSDGTLEGLELGDIELPKEREGDALGKRVL